MRIPDAASGGPAKEPSPGATKGPRPDERPSEEQWRAFADSHNAFSFALYQQLSRGPGNRVFSPLSIRAALATAWDGARGETAGQMATALRLGQSGEQVHARFASLLHRSAGSTGDAEGIAMANSLWVQAGSPFRAEFLERMEHFYPGSTHAVEFRHAHETARAQINAWIARETQQKVLEVMGPGSVDATTRLVLANACNLLGKWEHPFPAEKTTLQPFHRQDGSQVGAPLMRLKADLRYSEHADYQAVELGYRHCGLSMLVLLPRTKDGLPALEARLSADGLQECLARMSTVDVTVFLPRFRMGWSGDLDGHLRALGVHAAFDRSSADFSGINHHRFPHDDALSISRIRHEAWIETDEQGTRASAATYVAMCMCAPPVLRADHPFLFVIRGQESGAIWFLGRVTDPTA